MINIKTIVCLLCTLLVSSFTTPKKLPEAYYRDKYCQNVEFRLSDGSKADCINQIYITEVDFHYKWAEAVGQALWYSYISELSPRIILIYKDKNSKTVMRAKILCKKYNIKLKLVPIEKIP